MGLFAHRPEEPTDWAGLPSEPERVRSSAERLGDGGAVEVGLAGILGDGTGAIESIVIPVSPVIEIAQDQGSGEGE